MQKLIIDQGYSSAKVKFQDKLYKFPTAVSFHSDVGVAYGEEDVYIYKGEKYYVGEEAKTNESFVTTDIGYKLQFDPLLLFATLKKLNIIESAQKGEIGLTLSLALADWKHKDQYLESFLNFEVNNTKLQFNPTDITLLPQGSGSYINFVNNQNGGKHPNSAVILDIGANTINLMAFKNGQPQKAHSRGFPGHGVMVSIIQPFTSYLETKYNMPFSNAEAMDIFTSGKFIFNGSEQPDITQKIIELKNIFVKKLFNSVLTSEKKLLATSEKVIFCGGGCYMLENIQFPPNVILTTKPYEFSNIAAL